MITITHHVYRKICIGFPKPTEMVEMTNLCCLAEQRKRYFAKVIWLKSILLPKK